MKTPLCRRVAEIVFGRFHSQSASAYIRNALCNLQDGVICVTGYDSVTSPKLVLECVVVNLAVRILIVTTCVVMVVLKWKKCLTLPS